MQLCGRVLVPSAASFPRLAMPPYQVVSGLTETIHLRRGPRVFTHTCSVDGHAVLVRVLRRSPVSWALRTCVLPGISGVSGVSAQPFSSRSSQSGPSCCP